MSIDNKAFTEDDRSRRSVGRLEIYRQREWGTVCDAGNWTKSDTDVACVELGFAESLAPFKVPPGSDNTTIWLKGIACKGNEESLLSCSQDSGNNCSHADDVGVRCKDEGAL